MLWKRQSKNGLLVKLDSWNSLCWVVSLIIITNLSIQVFQIELICIISSGYSWCLSLQGNLRIGYSYTAKEHSDATHKIPRDFKEGNDNYPQITNAIKAKLKNDVRPPLILAVESDSLHLNFIQDGGYYPVFYLEKDITKANYIFDWLIEKSCASDPHYEQSSPFRIYSLDKLFYELRRHSDLKNPRLVFPSMVIVSDALKGITSSSFDHHPNVPCQVRLVVTGCKVAVN